MSASAAAPLRAYGRDTRRPACEHSRLGVCTNSCTDFASPRVIEGNVFRDSGNGVSFAFGSSGGEGVFDESPCRDNVIAGNRIDGHADGISLLANPGGSCVQNAIRDNTISVSVIPGSVLGDSPMRALSREDRSWRSVETAIG